MRGILSGIGVLLIIAWLVLWLAVHITFAAIHLLVVAGVVLLLIGLFRSAARTA